MNKKELIEMIDSIVDFISDGTVVMNNRKFNGHPNFYLIHSKEDFNKKLKTIIINKERYDRYDLFYYTNYMFKYMLNQYDSHTRMRFTDNKYLPIKIRFIDKEPYIVDGSKSIKKMKGAKILKINGIDIKEIIKELDNIICYASYEYLKITLEDYITNTNILMSLPIINKSNNISISTDKGEIEFNLDNLEKYTDSSRKENYSLSIEDKTAIITYNHCDGEEKMIDLINKLKTMKNITNYIIDLRGNGGGNSSVNKPLIKFLKGKNIIALCDERVFSSARMCLIDLKNIGAKVIGTNPGTPISCFGNCTMQKEFDDMKLKVQGSATYWYFDEAFQCHGIYKEDFEKNFKENPHLLDHVYYNIDDKIELTLTDYINNEDSVLKYALSIIKNKKENNSDKKR